MIYRLIDSETGKPFTMFSSRFYELWDRARDLCSEEYACDIDDVDFQEGPDGNEVVLVRGWPRAVLEWYR